MFKIPSMNGRRVSADLSLVLESYPLRTLDSIRINESELIFAPNLHALYLSWAQVAYIMVQTVNSRPKSDLLGPTPHLTPILNSLIMRRWLPSYESFMSQRGHDFGGANTWHSPLRWRARPSWNEEQVLMFLPGAHGVVSAIQRWAHVCDL